MTHIRLSSEGVWYHDGVEVTHERTIALFFKSLIFRDGKYYLTGEKEPVAIEVEDTAYFIRGLDKNDKGYAVKISDGTSESLALSSLDTGTDNQLYCRVHDDNHRAKFDRKVYYELMKDLLERDGYYGLTVGGFFYPIKTKEIVAKALTKQNQTIKSKKEKVEKSKKKVVKTKTKETAPAKAKTKKIAKKSAKKNVSTARKKSPSKKRR